MSGTHAMRRGKMKYVEWRNEELDEPLCWDAEDGNILSEYDEESIFPGEVIIDEDGYCYLVKEGEIQDSPCMEGLNFMEYVDEKHIPMEY
jgi:hypothetical protein